MIKPLRTDSTLVQHGSMLCTVPWMAGNLLTLTHDPILGAFFMGGSTIGFIEGQKPSGVVDRYTVGFFGYAFMMYNGFVRHEYGDVVAAVGGMVSCARAVADNIGESRYAAKKRKQEEADAVALLKQQNPYDVKVNKPSFGKRVGKTLAGGVNAASMVLTKVVQMGAHVCQSSTNKKLQKFGDDVMEITQRPMFSSSLIGGLFDAGYLVTGIQNGIDTGKWNKAIAGFLWLGGWGINGVSVPEEKRTNIFVDWFKNGRDAVKKKLGYEVVKDRKPFNDIKPE